MKRTGAAVAFVATGLVTTASPALALETRIAEIRTIGNTVRASVDIRDVFSEKFRQILQTGGTLHVRVQAELWEDRPIWDRLVRPAIVTVFRIARERSSVVLTISDAFGKVFSVAPYPEAVPLRVDCVPSDAITDASRYYLRLVATVGTIAERDIEETGEDVFGRDEGNLSLGKVGKFLFHTVLQVGDYLQSVSSEARSRVFHGRELRPGIR